MMKKLLVLSVALITGCQSSGIAKVDAPEQQDGMLNRISELQVVDCLLPGQTRMIGSQPYITPRRPTRTTASDCSIRGGEFVAFDQANYKTALSVWMPQAESGDAEAQANVGEIFERGLGGEPNYQAAKIWYEKAALQGNRKAQFNLGTLYEQGLGVDKDMVAALEWYRQAWGLPEEELIFKSAMDKEVGKLKAQLEQEQLALKKEVDKKGRQISLLEKQISSLKSQNAKDKQLSSEQQSELSELTAMVDELKQEKEETLQLSQNVEQKIRLRQPTLSLANRKVSDNSFEAFSSAAGSFGNYYALVIGNSDYQNIDKLMTPRYDTERVANLLETKYGFNVIRMLDSDNISIMDAINNLNDVIKEEDNLLIYYAGHGNRVQSGENVTGYWLPVNADAPPRDTLWISNDFVTRHIDRIKAKRVLVVADSCFAGLLSDAPGHLLLKGQNQANEKYIRFKKPRRARLMMASGGDMPVLDNGGGNHSVFAKAFIDVLESSDGIMTGPQVFEKVKSNVVQDAQKLNFEQTPEYKVIKGAGHEMGDFFFVPVETQKS